MRFDGGIIIGLNNRGSFVCRFDGENTFDLIENSWHCKGNACYEVVLKYFDENALSGSGVAIFNNKEQFSCEVDFPKTAIT